MKYTLIRIGMLIVTFIISVPLTLILVAGAILIVLLPEATTLELENVLPLKSWLPKGVVYEQISDKVVKDIFSFVGKLIFLVLLFSNYFGKLVHLAVERPFEWLASFKLTEFPLAKIESADELETKVDPLNPLKLTDRERADPEVYTFKYRTLEIGPNEYEKVYAFLHYVSFRERRKVSSWYDLFPKFLTEAVIETTWHDIAEGFVWITDQAFVF